jgi:competence CoiA-like predicted nuclease
MSNQAKHNTPLQETGVDHATLSEQFNKDEPRVNWHDETLWFIRQKRDKAAHNIPEWEQLRETASQIKNNVLSNLSEYLVQFEQQAKINGALFIGLLMRKNIIRSFYQLLSSTTKRDWSRANQCLRKNVI